MNLYHNILNHLKTYAQSSFEQNILLQIQTSHIEIYDIYLKYLKYHQKFLQFYHTYNKLLCKQYITNLKKGQEKNETSNNSQTKERQKDLFKHSSQDEKDQCSTKTHERRYKIMINNLYSIKDELSGYGSPVPIQDEAQALRWWHEILTNDRLMSSSPKDFSLWQIGIWNTETGEIKPIEHKLIERGKENA